MDVVLWVCLQIQFFVLFLFMAWTFTYLFIYFLMSGCDMCVWVPAYRCVCVCVFHMCMPKCVCSVKQAWSQLFLMWSPVSRPYQRHFVVPASLSVLCVCTTSLPDSQQQSKYTCTLSQHHWSVLWSNKAFVAASICKLLTIWVLGTFTCSTLLNNLNRKLHPLHLQDSK